MTSNLNLAKSLESFTALNCSKVVIGPPVLYGSNKFILSSIEEFVYYGIADEFKNLGASYILTALTLVNQDVANALPWLYQSVVA